MRHFAHHIGDYAAATAHLSFVEDGAYHRLLRRYYQDERPLPADVKEVQRLVGARSKEERQAVANVLAEFFDLEADGYHQRRADEEIEAYRVKADIARQNGTKSRGRPVRKSKPTRNPSGFASEPMQGTNHSPVRETPSGFPVTEGSQTPSSSSARESAEGARTHDTSPILENLGKLKRVAQ